MKKLLIVGSGISGLCAAVYAARSGFDVTVLEQHNTFGGLSTGWSRKGYFFEGGMHWLTGSGEKFPLNKIWKEVGALQENNPIENRDPLYTVLDGKNNLKLFRYLNEMKNELLNYSPEDSKIITKICRHVKTFTNFYMPIFDIKGCKCRTPVKPNLFSLMKMLPAILLVPKLSKISYEDYVSEIKNENIKHLLMSVIGYRYNALSFIYTLASFASGDCGYPKGGSIRLAKNIEQTFENLGGKILYRTKVEKVVIENGITKGVMTKDGFMEADAVIVTQDARRAVDSLFDEPIHGDWTDKLRKNVVTEQNMFISLGVKADLSALPYCCILPLEKPFEYAGLKFNEIRINNYARYPEHAPAGCTALTCLLIGDSYEFWKKAKEDGTYKAKKAELAELFIDTVSKFIPEVKANLEVTDVATPLTYERYCSSYEGSWMSVWTKTGHQDNYPAGVKGVSGLYFAGQRLLMPGGLPIAAYTGRRAVQYLCRDTNTEFV